MEELALFVETARKKKASDVHLVSGSLPVLRIDGELSTLAKQPLEARFIQKIVAALLSQTQLKQLEEHGDVDVGVRVSEVGLRVNIHKQSEGLSLAIRIIPSRIPSPEDLMFAQTMLEIPSFTDGMVIVSGATGSGKSTTLAAIIERINEGSSRHIITLEDPIEYRFTTGKSLIEQRQLGTHFPSFHKGLRHVLRQDPDVIVVGEMRDPETISLALTAAETGHLVLSTLHAPNASEVVERIVNVFEGAQQAQVLVQLAATLRMVVAQRLVPKKGGGLVAAREILTSTLAVQNAIRQNNLSVIRSSIQTGRKQGMVSMDLALKELQKEGIIA